MKESLLQQKINSQIFRNQVLYHHPNIKLKSGYMKPWHEYKVDSLFE